MMSLLKIRGFPPFLAILFINAFVDTAHKILIQNTIFSLYTGVTQVILTAVVNALILLPFILFFTPSGWLADRINKTIIMKMAAASAVVLSMLITLSYYAGWFEFSFAMTFLLAIQSTFYSPAKYGYIRDIAGKDQLSTANGLIQSATIIAILLAMLGLSLLFDTRLSGYTLTTDDAILQRIAPLGWILVILSLLEYYLTTRLPVFSSPTHSAIGWEAWHQRTRLHHNLALIQHYPVIWTSIIGLAIFWSISQVVIATFPAYAKSALGLHQTAYIQALLASSGIGIMLGALFAGRQSQHYIETALIPLGAGGMVLTLFLLTILSSTSGLFLNILAFGFFGGIFIVPLNALIQFHAPAAHIGTILAGNNWVQNIGMLSFLILTIGLSFTHIPPAWILQSLPVITLLGMLYLIWHLPQSLVRLMLVLIFATRYHIRVQGLNHFPSQGAVLLLGNHISWLDWAMIQIACPRPVKFVMDKAIYQKWFLNWFLRLFDVIPIAPSGSKQALQAIQTRLQHGEVVCLFPEGTISRTGQIGPFKKGFERCVTQVHGVIIPFYLHGLWGSRFSRSRQVFHSAPRHGWRRTITVTFGAPLPITASAEQVHHAVLMLHNLAQSANTRS